MKFFLPHLLFLLLAHTAHTQQNENWQCLSYDWESNVIKDTIVCIENVHFSDTSYYFGKYPDSEIKYRTELDSSGNIQTEHLWADDGAFFIRTDYTYDNTGKLLERRHEIGEYSYDYYLYTYQPILSTYMYNDQQHLSEVNHFFLYNAGEKQLIGRCIPHNEK